MRKKDGYEQLTNINGQGWIVVKSVAEVGSGLNGSRPKLMRLLADADVSTIVVEHRDRLMRFGAEYVEAHQPPRGEN